MIVTSGQKRRALEIIKGARKALGGNIGLTDLLLDNMDELNSVSDARKIIKALGLPLVLTEGRGRFLMKNPRVPLSKSSKIPKRTRLQYRASVFGDQRTMRRVKGIRKGFVKKIGKRMTKISLLRKVAAVKAKARRQFTRNPERKTLRAKSIRDPHVYGLKHHVCVEADGKTIAQMKDTPEMRTLAKRFAKTYKRKHPAAVVTVVAY